MKKYTMILSAMLLFLTVSCGADMKKVETETREKLAKITGLIDETAKKIEGAENGDEAATFANAFLFVLHGHMDELKAMLESYKLTMEQDDALQEALTPDFGKFSAALTALNSAMVSSMKKYAENKAAVEMLNQTLVELEKILE